LCGRGKKASDTPWPWPRSRAPLYAPKDATRHRCPGISGRPGVGAMGRGRYVTITVEQIELWRTVKTESQRLEFKEAKNQYPSEKAYDYCVALANEGGGYLVLGMTDQPPRQITGTRAYENLVDLADKLFHAVGFRVDIEAVAHPEGRVLVFVIPSRPRGSAYHREGRYLMRAGASLVPMSEDRLRNIFAEGAPDWLEEPALSQLADERVVELLDVQTYFDLRQQPLPPTRHGILDRLEQEGFVRSEPRGLVISRLGAVLLAKHLPDFRDLERKAPRLVVYSGPSKLETKRDVMGSRGYAVGFQNLVMSVVAQLPQNEALEDSLRVSKGPVPVEVLRELVANALIHQDFGLTGASVVVEIYSDRIEISNPGDPIVPADRFIDGYQSRNERLADRMRRLRICEEKGSGIDRVVRWAELSQLPAPDLRGHLRRTVVTLRGPIQFADMARDDRIRACYQHCVLKYVMSAHMTNQSLRGRFGLGESKSAIVSQVIGATQDAGLIRPDEAVGTSRRNARYIPSWAS
jgi:ATP-dependent DNA helicase RecG